MKTLATLAAALLAFAAMAATSSVLLPLPLALVLGGAAAHGVTEGMQAVLS